LVLKHTYTLLRDNILLQNQRYNLLLRYYEYVNQTMYYKYYLKKNKHHVVYFTIYKGRCAVYYIINYYTQSEHIPIVLGYY